jgi:hypothetical protein
LQLILEDLGASYSFSIGRYNHNVLERELILMLEVVDGHQICFQVIDWHSRSKEALGFKVYVYT